MPTVWEDERYVRVYKRETDTLERLGWEGRSVWWELLRKFDRLGSLKVGPDPAAALARVTKFPLEIATIALRRLCDTGTVQYINVDGGTLFAPNYREAQEAFSSNKVRQKDKREKASAVLRAAALGIAPGPIDETPIERLIRERGNSPPDTKRVATDTKRVADSDPQTPEPDAIEHQDDPAELEETTRNVSDDTKRVAGDTPSLAEPSLAEPSLTQTDRQSRARACEAIDMPEPRESGPDQVHVSSYSGWPAAAAYARDLGIGAVGYEQCLAELKRKSSEKYRTLRGWDQTLLKFIASKATRRAQKEEGRANGKRDNGKHSPARRGDDDEARDGSADDGEYRLSAVTAAAVEESREILRAAAAAARAKRERLRALRDG